MPGRRPLDRRLAVASRVGGVAVALVLGASGCATSGYTYVANEDLGAYFRVPETFQVYQADEVLEPYLETHPEVDAATVLAQQWAVAFDGSADPVVDRFLQQTSDPSTEVAGYARIRTLPADERLEYSLESLRGELIPLEQAAQLGDRLEVRDVQEVVQDGGNGLKLTFAMNLPSGTLVFDQVAVVDDTTSRVYLLALGCSSECYDANRETIAAITESWTIEER